jgi:hypothetical protein
MSKKIPIEKTKPKTQNDMVESKMKKTKREAVESTLIEGEKKEKKWEI